MNERTLFEAAVAFDDPAERRSFVEKACKDNRELLQKVISLLKDHDEANAKLRGTELDSPSPGLTSIASKSDAGMTTDFSVDQVKESFAKIDTSKIESEDESEVDLSFLSRSTKPGSIGSLGHYEILQVLGQGGFGIVFKAFDEKLHRLVAIKVMDPKLASTSPPRKRFLREARSVAAIRNDNIVQVYSVEEQPIPYMVMEYIDGQTLQGKLDNKGPLDVHEVLYLGRQMASGLAAAHALAMIHRDIKPGNILIEQNAEQKVKITDFGLARTVDDASMTRTGLISGTPMYMAPEQALGQSLDHRTDLFSLGSVLYQMACGRPPFRAPNTIAVMRRVVEDTPRAMQEIEPDLPTWLVAIINKLLAKKPEDRFQSAKEVADLFERCQAELNQSGKVTCVGTAILEFAKTPTSPSSPTELKLDAPSKTTQPFDRRMLYLAAFGLLVLLSILFGKQFGSSLNSWLNPKSDNLTSSSNPSTSDTSNLDAPDSASKTGGLPSDAPKSSVVTASADRALAEWVISKGGTIQLDGLSVSIDKLADLPDRAFRVTLITLTANDCFTDEDFNRLRGVDKLDSIFVIGEQKQVTDRGLRQLADLDPPSLKTLQFYGDLPNVTDSSVQDINRLKRLKSLRLKSPQFSNAGLEKLTLPNLVELSIDGTKATPGGLKDSHDRLPSIAVFETGGLAVPSEEWSILSQWNLFTLGLIDCGLKDHDLSLLSSHTSLSKIELTGNAGLTDAGMPLLLPFQNLQHIVLDRNGVTDVGIDQLKGLPDLRILYANSLALTDVGIASISQFPKLQRLHLFGNKGITDVALEHLAKCQTLEILLIQECKQLTEAGVKKLRAALPKCQILSDFPASPGL